MIKECKIHGAVRHYRSKGTNYYRCNSCMGRNVANTRRKNKETLVAESGGSCKRCGYDECPAGLVFHHLDPATKEFTIGCGPVKGLEKMREESKKCVLLCQNCHSSLHYGAWNYDDLGA